MHPALIVLAAVILLIVILIVLGGIFDTDFFDLIGDLCEDMFDIFDTFND